MKYIRNFLIFFAVVVNSDTFCMGPQQIAPHFIAQDSRMMADVQLTGAFGEFLSAVPVVQDTILRAGQVVTGNKYEFTIVPQTLAHLPDNFQFSEAELGFHNLLHNVEAESVFLTLINVYEIRG